MKKLAIGFFLKLLLFSAGEDAFSQGRGIFSPVDIYLGRYINKSERFIEHQGKTIRHVHVKVLEPFGTMVDDTSYYYAHWPGKLGNFLHIKTREGIVRNLVLVNEGEEFDALLARETERLIRQSGFVKDSRTIITETGENTVDVTFVVGDLWSINGKVHSITSPTSFTLYEHNFLGLAHSIDNTFTYDFETFGRLGMYGSYSIPFLQNTYASLTAFYNTTGFSSLLGISLQRNFFTPLAKWAGGVAITDHNTTYDPFSGETSTNGQTNPDPGIRILQSRYIEQDYWAGRSFQAIAGNSAKARSSRVAVAARLNNINYRIRQPRHQDSLNLQQNSLFLLGTIGYYYKQYYVDRDIFRFGINEDVPEGMGIYFTGGYEFKEIGPRPYYSISASFGRHFYNFGNLSGGAGFGTFIRAGNMEEGAMSFNASYFSDLFKLNRWGFRQFVNTLGYFGINRLPNERVSINADHELYGFQSPMLRGNTKLAVNFQSVFYAPFAVMGFRFAPVALAGLGLIGEKNEGIFKGHLLQSYGLGLLVRNESLAFQTFQLSIAVYPFSPGYDGINYRFNPAGTYDLRYQDFVVGRPEIIPFK